MTLQELKINIENNAVDDTLIIFKETDEKFLSTQYINEIAKVRNLPVQYIQSIDEVLVSNNTLFGGFDDTQTDDALRVLYTEVYDWDNIKIGDVTSLIIVTNKFSDKTVEKMFDRYIIKMPKLETWQIQDYAFSLAEGVPEKQLNWLLSLCGNNIHRLQQELDKIRLFNIDERKYLFDDMVRDGTFDDLSSFNIFNLTNAITNKDYVSLLSILKEIDRIDVNEFGLLTILLRNFRNLIMVQLNSNPTPENTGLEAKTLYAVKRTPRKYSAEQLVAIFKFLSDIDKRVKTGELPAEHLIDYMILKILSV